MTGTGRVIEGPPSDDGWSEPAFYRTPLGPSSATLARRGRHRSLADAAAHGGLLENSRTIAIGSLASRLTGFLRSIALAAALGVAANGIADPFNGANSFPNMLYELLLGGVLASVLIPALVQAQERDSDRGVAFTQRLLSLATVALGAATLAAVAAAPVIAWTFVADPDKRHLTTVFGMLLLPEIFFYGLGAMIAAVLNTLQVYGPPAWAPVLNNLIMLATLGVFVVMTGGAEPTVSGITTAQILVLGIGTTLGIAAQAMCLVPSLRRAGFHWRWRFRAVGGAAARMREFRALAAWVLVYVALSQLGIAVITRIAFSNDGVSTFAYAALLFQMPYAILGVSVLTAMMPRLSRAAARGATAELLEDLRLGARLSGVALVPVTAALMVLGPAATTVMFVGHTTVDQARLIGTVVALAAFGLFPYALLMLQLRAFYALGDARTPALVNLAMVVTEIGLVLPAALLLDGDRVIEALGVVTSASYVLGALVGHLALRRRLGLLGFATVVRTVARVTLAAAVGGGAAYCVLLGVHHGLGTGRGSAAIALVGGATAGAIVFALVLSRLHVPEAREVLSALRG